VLGFHVVRNDEKYSAGAKIMKTLFSLENSFHFFLIFGFPRILIPLSAKIDVTLNILAWNLIKVIAQFHHN
jgi:hypothetical protein